MKIAIFGKMCSGKSTLFKYIQFYLDEKYNMKMKKVSFADKIYDIAYDLFQMKEKNRKLLQDIGENLRRIDEDIFTKYTFQKIYNMDHVIIEDCRLLSEFRYLVDFRDNQNDRFIKIKINITPEFQVQRLKLCYPDTYEDHLKNLNHRSEVELDNVNESEFDLILNAENNELNYDIVKNYLDTLLNNLNL